MLLGTGLSGSSDGSRERPKRRQKRSCANGTGYNCPVLRDLSRGCEAVMMEEETDRKA